MRCDQLSLKIVENTHVSEARRAANRLTQDLGFDSILREHAAIVVTELSRNVLLHAAGGEIILQPGRVLHGDTWMDVLALDKGGGIADISRALNDGYSSAGTAGTGFGAVARLSSFFDVYSNSKDGTAILARIYSGKQSEGTPPTTASVCLPFPGETHCGDAWEHQDQANRRLVMVADGLGHGAPAAEAAAEAVLAFRANQHKGPKEIIEAAHARLQKTRGAAVAVAEIDFERQIVRYSGIGNIAGAIVVEGKSRSMISQNGIVGHQSERLSEFTFPWQSGACLIMNSDGINTRWNLATYLGLQNKPAALIAAVLYRDFKRGKDDATVVVSREAKAV